jgi:hypothetical protein
MRNYDDQYRVQRQHSPDRTNDYTSQPVPTSSSSNLYQQNYGLSRSVTLSESQQHSRRSNNYNMPIRQMQNDPDMQQDGMKNILFLFYNLLYSYRSSSESSSSTKR